MRTSALVGLLGGLSYRVGGVAAATTALALVGLVAGRAPSTPQPSLTPSTFGRDSFSWCSVPGQGSRSRACSDAAHVPRGPDGSTRTAVGRRSWRIAASALLDYPRRVAMPSPAPRLTDRFFAAGAFANEVHGGHRRLGTQSSGTTAPCWNSSAAGTAARSSKTSGTHSPNSKISQPTPARSAFIYAVPSARGLLYSWPRVYADLVRIGGRGVDAATSRPSTRPRQRHPSPSGENSIASSRREDARSVTAIDVARTINRYDATP